MTHIVPTSDEHIAYMSIHARESDKDEVFKATGGSLLDALVYSRDESEECLTLVGDDGLPVVLFGVAPAHDVPGLGIPWLIATDELSQHRKTFHRYARHYRDEWLKRYRVLENYADADNVETLRWLAALGYTIDSPIFNERGYLIQRFHLCAS